MFIRPLIMNTLKDTHNLREDTGEPHEVVLIHVAMEEIAMWWWVLMSRCRANMLGVER